MICGTTEKSICSQSVEVEKVQRQTLIEWLRYNKYSGCDEADFPPLNSQNERNGLLHKHLHED